MTQKSLHPGLLWQSRIVLGLVLLPGILALFLECMVLSRISPLLLARGLVFGGALAVFVWRLRAATPAAAFTGGIITAILYFATPGWRTLLWPLIALFLLTFAATQFGRAHKELQGIAEAHTGRSAAQVAANLGVAAWAAITLGAGYFYTLPTLLQSHSMRLALVAALAEATADTLSSELGEVLGGEPRLLTTLRRVPAGTDGAVSVIGTITGAAGAAVIAGVAVIALNLSGADAALVTLAANLGLFFDSFLGAVVERRGWLNNDAVNFLSTLAAAILATGMGQC